MEGIFCTRKEAIELLGAGRRTLDNAVDVGLIRPRVLRCPDTGVQVGRALYVRAEVVKAREELVASGKGAE